MYVTRPLSLYRNNSSSTAAAAANEPEPQLEGPNTGVLVIQDEASESRVCFGLFKKTSVVLLPFPQNKILRLGYVGLKSPHSIDYYYILLIPVLNQPLSSNQYYIIKSNGEKKGLAYTCSKEDDGFGCRCFKIHCGTQPQLFDPRNAYQRFQIDYNYVDCGSRILGFVSKSVAPDGVPPLFLRVKGWRPFTKTLKNFEPTEALGLDAVLRARLPELSFSLPSKCSEPVVVGKWYCPFIFVGDGEVDSQMSKSPYYEMTLEQQWVEIFGCERGGEGKKGVDLDVCVEREVVCVAGQAMAGRKVGEDGVVWFSPSRVGLSFVIVERMKWEEGRGGFECVEEGQGKEVNVKRREEFEGVGVWRRFGCYVLVERFVLKRMDGSLVLTWEFRHTHQVRTKWE